MRSAGCCWVVPQVKQPSRSVILGQRLVRGVADTSPAPSEPSHHPPSRTWSRPTWTIVACIYTVSTHRIYTVSTHYIHTVSPLPRTWMTTASISWLYPRTSPWPPRPRCCCTLGLGPGPPSHSLRPRPLLRLGGAGARSLYSWSTNNTDRSGGEGDVQQQFNTIANDKNHRKEIETMTVAAVSGELSPDHPPCCCCCCESDWKLFSLSARS